jgi:hypothetical protein
MQFDELVKFETASLAETVHELEFLNLCRDLDNSLARRCFAISRQALNRLVAIELWD